MAGSIDRVAIRLRLNKDIELQCYPALPEFMKFLTETLSGEAQGTFGEVIISEITPESDDTNKLWLKINAQRNGFEQRLYINGEWQPWYFVPPSSYILFDGRAALPTGFLEIGRFTSAAVPVTKNGVQLTTPTEFIIANFIGY